MIMSYGRISFIIILFVNQKALIQTFQTSIWQWNNLCKFTTFEHEFKRQFCTQKRFYMILVYKYWSNSELVWQIQLISIKGALSKLLEKIVAFQMIRFLESQDILHTHQYGFRNNRDTIQINYCCCLSIFSLNNV